MDRSVKRQACLEAYARSLMPVLELVKVEVSLGLDRYPALLDHVAEKQRV